jgi:predicted nucleic acid-binding protein
MANIFLDVNKLIYYINGGDLDVFIGLRGNELVVSGLSWHIIYYLMKYKVPANNVFGLFSEITTVEMSNFIIKKAMLGPTDDFEDNVQLHSAVEGECDRFLTFDKKLLKMKFFGKMKICDKLD